jgi:hypothetical protein
MERGSRKRSSSARSEKMERVGDRQEKMEGYCSTGQSPQWAVMPMEEEEEIILLKFRCTCIYHVIILRKSFFHIALCMHFV